MSRAAAAIVLSVEERSVLGGWARGRSLPMRLVQRARIFTMAAGMQSQDIARQLRVSRPTVQLWRERFLATHWSTRAMARAQGVSEATVRRIWKRHRLKPHLAEPFKLSKDERFYDKLQDVVGLYLNPPDKALVLCVDEKSRIQALERTRPLLPLRPGQPARQTHDYKRTGTPTLFAALNMPDGKAIGDCMSRHRHQEFIRFLERVDTRTSAELDLHLIVDNYRTHKHKRVRAWLGRHPRFHLHFTPTSSWLNMVERWFRDLTVKRLRRGSFDNVAALEKAIEDYIATSNQNPHMFVWVATVESIMRETAKCREACDTLH